MDIQYLNSSTETYGYNCYSFALGVYNSWYSLKNYRSFKSIDIDEMLLDCVEEIKEENNLIEIPHPDCVPKNINVIGFRISRFKAKESIVFASVIDADKEISGDFHFILRHNGEWLHKPGPDKVSILPFDPYGLWYRENNLHYNSNIHWFVSANIDLSAQLCYN